MLPNYFLPEVDELPFSWMNRLALANGFKDTNDMLQSLGFIKGKTVKRQHDYLLKITKLMPKNDWTITLMKMYLTEDLQQERLIPELNEEEHLYLCPCCMQEDIKTHGAVVYHYQHQYPGAFTCWKHGVNLLHVAPDARLKPIPDESDLTPVVGGYDSEREMRQFRRCYSKSSLYYRITKYQLETLLSDNHLTVDNIVEVFRTTKYNEEMPVVAANIVCNSTMGSLTGYQKKNLLQLIFDDHPRYQRFLNNINYETMVGFEMKKLPNGHTVLHIKSANKYKMETYIRNNTSTKERSICKTSKREYRNNERMLRADNLCNVQGPGDLFEMDEVEMDVSIVSEADQTKVIGRPIVHAMLDVYSRMIAAVSVSLENNSVLGFTNCLLNLGEDNKQLEFINYDVVSSSYMLRKMYVWNEEDIQFSINEQTTRQIIKMRGKIEDSAPTGFALLGYSGCGKSTSLKQLFDNIPQVIMHHPDPATNITQITYLVVSCMPNSNFATLYRQIGEAIDNALGYPEPVYELMITKKCRSLAEKQLKVCELIEKFSIGTIVLDEIQLINFNSNKENSYEGLLGIVNKTKIALSVVGTDEAYKKLFGMLRNARRAGEYINASAYTSDKEYFNFLLSMLLTWQWLDKPITKEQAQKLSDTLYECTG